VDYSAWLWPECYAVFVTLTSYWETKRDCCAAICLLLLLLTALFSASQTAGSASKTKSKTSWAVVWQPIKLVNGAPVVFWVTPAKRLDSLSGNWLGHDVFFSFDQPSKTWYGIAGISLETKPGAYALQLKGTSGGQNISFERKISVGRAKYPTIAVTVSKQFTEPSPEQLQQINQEKALKQDVLGHFEPAREWAGGFVPPVTARVSDVFGTRRVFNGETKSVHQGLDYAVPQGTTVSALNAGTVLLAQPLFFEGNCIVLDHGQGLLTLYLHLSEFKVKAGEHVARGQEIGLSGGTGRATGPHLHIAVRWEGVYLDPATLLKMRLP
jgi:murein DD-endopeptidase MepM/ murein hydrolase activator NlpD